MSDKYAGQPYAPSTIPPGASFKDMVALKGKSTIGDDINKKIIAPLASANKLSDLPDFSEASKRTGKRCRDQRPGADEHHPAQLRDRVRRAGNTLADPRLMEGDTLRPLTSSSPTRRSPTSGGATASIR